MDDAQELQLQIQQARFLAERIDPFWNEGDPDGPGHTPLSVLADLDEAMRVHDGAIDAAGTLLADRWGISSSLTDTQRQEIVARQIQTANVAHDLVQLLVHGEIDGATTWSDVIAGHGDDEAAAAACRATVHAAAELGMQADVAVAQGVPAYAVLEIYPADDVIVAVARYVNRGADIAPLIADYADQLDPIRLAAALQIAPEELVRRPAPTPGLDLA